MSDAVLSPGAASIHPFQPKLGCVTPLLGIPRGDILRGDILRGGVAEAASTVTNAVPTRRLPFIPPSAAS